MDPDGYQLYLRAIVTLAFLLGVMVVVLWLLRRFNLVSANTTLRGRDRRLGIVETLAIDGRRRLVLIRRDGVEHLIVAGPDGESVIETGIAPPEPRTRLPPVLE